MTPEPIYVIDSDVFISAKNSYYAFAICPGFWASLLHHHDTFAMLKSLHVRYDFATES